VRDLFREARESAPAIIFIDEIDAIGRARGQFAVGGTSEHEQTLQQILTEMDGFSSREGVIVLAATNQPDILDKALLRPGRFDRRVVVNLPDRSGREAILKVHTRKVPLAPDVDSAEIASITPGFSGADLKNLVNETALLAARRNQETVHQKDFMDALEKIVLGPERPILLSDEDRRRIAYHEGGHGILGLVIPGADPVHRVTIVPRGMALGVTYQRPQTDRYNYPEAYLRARIAGMLGGRAAEEVVYGTRTTGAENDIEQATQLARNMVTRWGMSDKVGMVQLAPRQNPYLGGTSGFAGAKPFGEETASLVDAEVHRIIDDCYEEAKRLLGKHRKETRRARGCADEPRNVERRRDLRRHGPATRCGPGEQSLGNGSPARVSASRAAKPRGPPRAPQCSRGGRGLRLARKRHDVSRPGFDSAHIVSHLHCDRCSVRFPEAQRERLAGELEVDRMAAVANSHVESPQRFRQSRAEAQNVARDFDPR
jgi:ATP-dependent metalloprotease FtsH